MKNLRFWTTALIIWLIFFFNIERFFGSGFNIILTDTYIFVAIVVVATLLLPRLRVEIFSLLLVTTIAFFLVFWVGHPVWRKPLSFDVAQVIAITLLTLIQISTIILSGLLSRQISAALREFEKIIDNITYSYIGITPKPFHEEQGVMYGELKRARHYSRPLSVVALKIAPGDIKLALPKLILEVQQAMMNEFALAGIARILDRELHDFDLIALRDNCFILVLPELVSEEIPVLTQRLGRAVQEEVGVKLQVGVANYPLDAETFESLIEQAIENTARLKSAEADTEHTRLEVSPTT